jgi:methionine-gamma-lyase
VSERHIGTAAVHAGRLPILPGDPVIAPVHRSVIYEFESAAEFGEIMADERRGYLYTRIRNPSTDELAAVIAELEGARTAHCFASGMGALTAAISVMAPPRAGVVAAKQIYGQTHHLVSARDDGRLFDLADLEGLREACDGAALVVVETLSNPNLAVADLPAICEVAHAAGARVLVDNTVATPVNCRPLEWGADMVTHSATKYLNGHSDVLAGVAAGPEPLMAEIRTLALELGATLSPDSAWLVRRGIRTLHLRVERASQNAMRIAELLEAHPRVRRVVYPGLPSHPAHDVARRILDGFGAMLAFEVEGGRPAGEAVMDRVRLCLRATSLGGVETCVSHPASTSHRQLSDAELEAAGIRAGDLRLAVGIEDADDLIEDLDQALR